jgi:hypothetical protein
MVKGKEVPQGTSTWVEESVEDNFTTTQKLSLKVDVHSSTLSFALETLAQHRVLIGQLQDEVDYLCRHGESLQRQLDKREIIPEAFAQEKDTRESCRHETKRLRMLPDLNLVVVSSVEEGMKKEEV